MPHTAATDPPPHDRAADALDAAGAGWQSLPPAARLLCQLDALRLWGLLGIAAGFGLGVLGTASGWDGWLATSLVLGVLLGAAVGWYRGAVRFASTRWRLDADGLGLRHGRMWQREVRVPTSRVQHLDLQRGPLQRARGLATLVVHTAGSAHAAVGVPHLPLHDAEALREALSQPALLDPPAAAAQ